MSVLEGIQTYYSLFGCYGVFLVAKKRLLQTPRFTAVSVPHIRYPVYLRLRTSDVSVFRQVFVIREYDCEFSKPPRVIVDAGANVGLTSVFYANKFPEAKIVAVEPESGNFEVLKMNTHPYPNILPVLGALWKENKQLRLVNPDSREDGFQTLDQPQSDIEESYGRAPGITVDKLMEECDIDYIDIFKVDIEGAEKEVFEDPSAWMQKVGVIVIELHDRLREGCSNSVHSVTSDFEYEWCKGETTFLVRKGYATHETSQQFRFNPSEFATKPFKILRTA